jgi:hypothetical protein
MKVVAILQQLRVLLCKIVCLQRSWWSLQPRNLCVDLLDRLKPSSDPSALRGFLGAPHLPLPLCSSDLWISSCSLSRPPSLPTLCTSVDAARVVSPLQALQPLLHTPKPPPNECSIPTIYELCHLQGGKFRRPKLLRRLRQAQKKFNINPSHRTPAQGNQREDCLTRLPPRKQEGDD